MGSEDFVQVSKIGRVEVSNGIKFNLTLDHSQVIFKMDNVEELKFSGLIKNYIWRAGP